MEPFLTKKQEKEEKAEAKSAHSWKMPAQDLIHYRSDEPTTYPVVRGGSSDNSSLFLGSGAEDWVTKKRVETKTTKNVEKRIQRQVNLKLKNRNL